MRILITALLILGTFIGQTSLVDVIAISTIRPNLLITLTVIVGLMGGSERGGWTGLAIGILMDMLSGRVFGMYSILGLLVGIIAGFFQDSVFLENALSAIFLSFCFVFGYEIIFFIINYVLWGQTHIWQAIWKYALPTAVYSAVFAGIFYRPLLKLEKWLRRRERYW